MKNKLKNLESAGINPTRDHVMKHLDAIKDLTFGNFVFILSILSKVMKKKYIYAFLEKGKNATCLLKFAVRDIFKLFYKVISRG